MADIRDLTVNTSYTACHISPYIVEPRYDVTIDYRRRFCQASNIEGSLIKPILGAKMDGTLTQCRQIAMTSAPARDHYSGDVC